MGRPRTSRRRIAVIAATALLGSAVAAQLSSGTFLAAPGDVDASFGTGGIAVSNTHTATQDDVAIRATARTPSGTILVLTDSRTDTENTARAMVVLAYAADGTPAMGYGAGGKAVVDRGPLVQLTGVGLDVLPDGSAVVVGNERPGVDASYPSRTIVAKITPTGSLDPSFDGDGVAVIDLDPATPFAQAASAIAAYDDGRVRIAIAGPGTSIVGLAADGTLDPSFGTNGILATSSFGLALGVQSTGTLVVFDGAVTRFDPSGNVLGQTPGVAFCAGSCALAIDATDRIVVASRAGEDFRITRLTAAGTPDPTFGTSNGTAVFPAPDLSYPSGAVVTPSGRIYLATQKYTPVDPDNGVYAREIAVIGLDTTGTALAFGTGGAASLAGVTDSNTSTETRTVVAVGDDVIVAANRALGKDAHGLLARIDATGTVAATFGDGGVAEVRVPTVHTLDERIDDIATDALGRAVGVGYVDSWPKFGPYEPVGNSRRVLVARWTAAHAPDPSFGGDGTVDIDTGRSNQHAVAVAIDSTGRVLVLSETFEGPVVTRLLPDGSLDATFGTAGHAALDASLAHAHDIGVDGSNRAVVTGTGPGLAAARLAVRLDATGGFDPSFGSGGTVTPTFGLDPTNNPEPVRVNVAPDGSAVLATTGNLRVSFLNQSRTSVVRLSSSGSAVTTFGTAGLASAGRSVGPIGGVLVDASGRILVAGASGSSINLARFLPTGALDTTLAASGIASATSFTVVTAPYQLTARAIAQDAFGNTLVLASAEVAPDQNRPRPADPGAIALARFGEFGADQAYGTSGMVVRNVTAHDAPAGLAASTTSRLMVYGSFEPQPGFGHDPGVVAVEQAVPVGGDTIAPTITTNVAPGTVIRPATVFAPSLSCNDTGGSGIASCSGPFAGPAGFSPASVGMNLRTLYYRAIDGAGNVTDLAVPVFAADWASGGFRGVPISTFGANTEATADDPIETSLILRSGPGITVAEVPVDPNVAGYTTVPWQVELTTFNSSTALAIQPLTVQLDSTIVASAGLTTANLVAMRSGVPLATCDGSAISCVDPITSLPSGDLVVTMRLYGPMTGVTVMAFGRLGVDTATGTFGAGGGTVTTGNVATPSDPIESTLTSPVAGTITVTEQTTASVPPTGFSLLGNEVVITAPTATPANPLRFVFRLDATLLAAGGVTPETVTIFRNGVAVPACTNPAAVSAAPDPCVFQRTLLADGDAEIGVYTSAASTWAFGKHAPYAFSGFLEWSAYPTLNTAKGGNIEVVFGLGGNQGLAFFAARSPNATPVDCTTLAPTGAATPIAHELEYNKSKARYEVKFDVPKSWRDTCRTVSFTFIDGSTQRLAFRIR